MMKLFVVFPSVCLYTWSREHVSKSHAVDLALTVDLSIYFIQCIVLFKALSFCNNAHMAINKVIHL